MEYEIVGRHTDMPQPVKDYLAEKRDKLAKFFDRMHHLRVVIEEEGPNRKVELIATLVKSDVVIAKGMSTDLFAAIDEAADKMEAQLRKYKSKLREHRVKPEEAAEAPAVETAEESETE